MTRTFLKALGLGAASLVMAAPARAQFVVPDWDFVCIDPDNQTPYSNDYSQYWLVNDLWGVTMGLGGTVAYGADQGCFGPNGGSVELAGRIGFRNGRIGSVQDDDLAASYPGRFNVLDNNLSVTFGMPFSVGADWGYAAVIDPETGTRTPFGGGGWELAFVGASNRYFVAQTIQDNIRVKLQADLIGDAARLSWTLGGTDATERQRQLWFGQFVAFIGETVLANAGYVNVPGQRPVVTDRRFNRTTDPSLFPETVLFGVSQEIAYGLQVLNGPTPFTTDSTGVNSDQTEAFEFVIGEAGWVVGDGGDINTNNRTFTDRIFPDTTIFNYGYIQKFPTFVVPPSTQPFDTIQPQVVAYYKSTTGVSNYSLPYGVVVDTPKLVQVEQDNPEDVIEHVRRVTSAGLEEYFNFRVYVDNVGGFGKVDLEVPLEGVRVTLNLPDGMFEYKGPNQRPDDRPRRVVRFIDRVAPRGVSFVDFKVGVDPTAYGNLEYNVKIDPGSTIVSKTLTGSVNVAARPRLLIKGQASGGTGANLVSPPWEFESTNWETILSYTENGIEVPWRLDDEFRAYTYDANIQRYIPQSGPERQRGTWIIARRDRPLDAKLNGDPKQPSDLTPRQGGAPLITLRPGWNLIGNPYNYAFPLRQAIGISGSIGTQSNTFQQLVDQGVVSGALAYWDQETQSYKYIDYTQEVLPNRGYWIYVYTAQDVTLSFPPVFQPFLFGATDAAGAAPGAAWRQSENNWRLQLSAISPKGRDDQNYVGLVASAKEVRRNRMTEPPIAPIEEAVSLAIKGNVEGKDRLLTRDFTEKKGRSSWDVTVTTGAEGPVTVSWPNLGTLPRNLRFRLVDVATGATRDMRRNSGYTFTATKESLSRSFKVEVEPGASVATKIGSVVVSGNGSRGPASAVTIQYSLTGAATTTVRILAADGREIYVAARGRADKAGANTVTWTKRDATNRAVPPGTYRAEIVAETDSGERVRKLVPIIVVR